jgi:D-amino-acid dehydrogenase
MAQRVVIIGAGVIGLCAAWACARRGHRVTVVERGGPERDGCSFGNAGMIVPSHFTPLAAPGMVALGLKWMWNPESPFYIRPRLSRDLAEWGFRFWRAANAEHVRRAAPLLRDLSLASRTCFEELAALAGTDFGLVKRGLLMLCRTLHALEEEAQAVARSRELGIPAKVLDAGQAAALDPGLRLDIVGAVHFPLDCHLNPARFMAALQALAAEAGVQFVWNAEAAGWRREGRRVTAVCTRAGEIAGDEFVLAGGSWSPGLARELGLKLPLQAGKGYSLTLPLPRQLPQLCFILVEARVAVTPMDGALRIGGTMEIAGLNETINPRRVRGIIKAALRYLPEFQPEDFQGIKPWCGLRPVSPDGLPYLGRTARLANLCVATGHGMMGLSLGPITGQLLADLISGERPAWNLDLLSPDRHG